MTIAKLSIEIEAKVAWWFWPYINATIFFCKLRGAGPNEDRLHRMINRAIRVRIK